MAEGLAQAAVHDGWIAPLLLGAEKAAEKHASQPSKTMVELVDACHADRSLYKAADVDGNRIREGILKTASQTMIDIISQYHLSSDSVVELEEQVAAMTNTTAYFTGKLRPILVKMIFSDHFAGAAQRPSKAIKMDFFYMHTIRMYSPILL